MRDFYEQFYQRAPHSPVHAEFCARVFGRDLCQHGFADMAQLDALLALTRLSAWQHLLDVGCGCGMIAEYIADSTGAQVTGLDYIPAAIEQARTRTAHKADRLSFIVGDINALALPPAAYDVISSIDSLYFSTDCTRTIAQWVAALRPGGQLVIFFSHGPDPWLPREVFRAETLPADRTPCAEALAANGLTFTAQDFTQADHTLAVRRKQVLETLRPRFEAEGLLFVYENRLGDAEGIRQAFEDNLHRRYLYHASLPG